MKEGPSTCFRKRQRSFLQSYPSCKVGFSMRSYWLPFSKSAGDKRSSRWNLGQLLWVEDMMILACLNLLPKLDCYLSYCQLPLPPTASKAQKPMTVHTSSPTACSSQDSQYWCNVYTGRNSQVNAARSLSYNHRSPNHRYFAVGPASERVQPRNEAPDFLCHLALRSHQMLFEQVDG